MQCFSSFSTYNSVLASVTSDSKQLLVHFSATAGDFLERNAVSLSVRNTTVISLINVTHLSFPANTFRFSLPRFPPNTTKSGKFNPLCYLQTVYPSYRSTIQKVTQKIHKYLGWFTKYNNAGPRQRKANRPLLLAPPWEQNEG